MYKHLGLKEWPFQVVPTDDSIQYFAGRKDFYSEVVKLIRYVNRTQPSSLNLLWAWFGSGKTHTLMHMRYLCQKDDSQVYPIYCVLPGSIKSFSDLHSAIIDSLNYDDFKEMYSSIRQDKRDEEVKNILGKTGQNVFNAIQSMSFDNSELRENIVRSWMRAEKVPLKELQKVSITHRIETAADCVAVLSALFKFIAHSGKYKRVLLMVDEFQEVANLKGNRLLDVSGNMHKLYDSNAQNLHIFLSFTTGVAQTLRYSLQDALWNRVMNRLQLPKMSKEEAIEFVSELLAHHQLNGSKGTRPFSSDAIAMMIDCMIENKVELIPRRIMTVGNKLLSEADLLIEEGKLAAVEAAYVEEAFKKGKIIDNTDETTTDD
jgi:hypothetical protein